MASAGRVGVGIGTGAAGGAMTGASFGPWGAVIGGGIGAIGGAISSLLSSSDEAKERKRAMDEYQRQRDHALGRYQEDERNRAYDDWERRYVALTPGLAQDPMYIASKYEPYNPELAAAKFDANAGPAPTLPAEPAPNYGALVQSLGSLGATVGGLSRQADAQSRLDDLIQSRRIAATGNPWQSFADTQQGDDLEKLLEKARADAWNRTGGW